jgi:metal-responsive CopG/Arc/MetJ family transcriptional regulator
MKTIQMTIDEPLLREVDRVIVELDTTRSAFIREALEAALRRHEILKLEQQHAHGYSIGNILYNQESLTYGQTPRSGALASNGDE